LAVARRGDQNHEGAGHAGGARAVAAAIIAGGPATRLGGAAKPGLVIGGRSIAARQVEALRAAFTHVLVVANHPDPGLWRDLGVQVVADRRPGAGPLGGVHAALSTAAAGPWSDVVCVAGDMPFLPAPVLALLRDHAPGADAVAVRTGGRPEPLLARYAARCLPEIEARLDAGERAIHRLLDGIHVAWIEEAELRAVDPTLSCLTNVNTPEDLERLARLVAGVPPPRGR
jgi:molybdopterin-guanine dinucleotide biosynthesis protein A